MLFPSYFSRNYAGIELKPKWTTHKSNLDPDQEEDSRASSSCDPKEMLKINSVT